MNPNILYFAGSGLSEGVGGSARLKNMLDVLKQLKADIRLISYLQGQRFEVKHIQMDNHLNMTTISVRGSLPRILKGLALIVILMQGLKHVRKADMIFAHAPTAVTGFPALILAKLFGKPLLIDHMDIRSPDTPDFIYRYVLNKSSIVFAISRYLEEEAKQLGCQNAIYLPIFIDTNAFQRDARERVIFKEKLGIKEKEIVIGYTGSFWHVEGVPFLVKAFKGLSDRYENVKLVLVGGRNVPGSDDVPQLINELALEEKVIVVPQQPYELIPKYLSAFDVACSPKIDCAENRAANPIKIYEYMSMGLPTVLSAVGEISNVIENGVDGFLTRPGDEKDLEKTLEYVIQNIDSLQEVGRKAREKVIKNYTQEAMSKKVETNLKKLVSENG